MTGLTKAGSKLDTYGVTLDDIREAARRIEPYAYRTPIMTCATIDAMAERSIVFKCENFQKIGAFKFRGACNAIMGLSDADAARGVVTQSSGNHAQAVALAAKLRGIDAHIIMPASSVAVKKRAVLGYGAQVYECDVTEKSRDEVCDRVEGETGAVRISPFDQPEIIAGQGTATLELLEQAGEFDAIVAPIGGGGLMSGTSIAATELNEKLRIIGAEPKGADDAARSLAAGKFIPLKEANTIADGLRTSTGKFTWPIIRDHVERIITISEEDIVSSMRLIWERMKIVIEPSAAVAVAAILSDEFKGLEGIDKVGVIISGGNVDFDNLPW